MLPGKVSFYPLGFVCFDRTGMRLLFGDADFRQDLKNLATLDFQLARQIIDSNLHPPCVFPSLVRARYAFITTSRFLSLRRVLTLEFANSLLFFGRNLTLVRVLAVGFDLGDVGRRSIFNSAL